MLFIDNVTKATLDVANDFVIEQFKKYPERYSEVKKPSKKDVSDK